MPPAAKTAANPDASEAPAAETPKESRLISASRELAAAKRAQRKLGAERDALVEQVHAKEGEYQEACALLAAARDAVIRLAGADDVEDA